jgi:hypothetical protein
VGLKQFLHIGLFQILKSSRPGYVNVGTPSIVNLFFRLKAMEVSDYIRPNLSPNPIHARLHHFCPCISIVVSCFSNVKIYPEICYRKLVFTVGILNQLGEHLLKIITPESDSDTLIHRSDKRCVGRQEHDLNVLVNIRNAWDVSRSNI